MRKLIPFSSLILFVAGLFSFTGEEKLAKEKQILRTPIHAKCIDGQIVIPKQAFYPNVPYIYIDSNCLKPHQKSINLVWETPCAAKQFNFKISPHQIYLTSRAKDTLREFVLWALEITKFQFQSVQDSLQKITHNNFQSISPSTFIDTAFHSNHHCYNEQLAQSEKYLDLINQYLPKNHKIQIPKVPFLMRNKPRAIVYNEIETTGTIGTHSFDKITYLMDSIRAHSSNQIYSDTLQEQNRTIIRSFNVLDEGYKHYKKIEYSWGGVYHFKNNISITKREYDNLISNREKQEQ